MKTSLIAALAFLATAVAVVAPSANAGPPCSGEPINIADTLYIAPDDVMDETIFSIWVYAESNGVANLQRGGVTLLGEADICQAGGANPDLGVF